MTSTGREDAGLFQLDLQDARYLPFEGAGAISTWRLELPSDIRQFDFETISDVVLHVRYTAREAGHLRPAATDHAKSVLQAPEGLVQLMSLDVERAAAWHAFTAAATDEERVLSLRVTRDDFPYWVESLGMCDELSATFAMIDWARGKLTLAPAVAPLVGDASTGWLLRVEQGSPVFPFLRRNAGSRIYMALSYAAAS